MKVAVSDVVTIYLSIYLSICLSLSLYIYIYTHTYTYTRMIRSPSKITTKKRLADPEGLASLPLLWHLVFKVRVLGFGV